MKAQPILALFFVLLTGQLFAQQKDYRVIFDMSTRDTVSQQALMRELDLIRKENPAAKLEVVVYGQAMSLVTKDKSKHADAITRLAADSNTSFKVCSFTMKRFNVDEKSLVSGVKIVQDGIYEIISKQREGWGYIKVAH